MLSRRSVLRNAALLSLAGAASNSPFRAFAQSCSDSQPDAYQFQPGIRVFFAGAWIFCPSKTGGVLAVTTDLPGPDAHSFPYGAWTPDIDKKASLMIGNYSITVDAVNSASPNIDALFNAVCNDKDAFYFLSNDDGGLSVTTSGPKVRAISLPIPTRILPAAFITNAKVSGGGKRLQPCKSPLVPGLASTHIFDYQGASSLKLLDGAGNQVDSAGQDNNYHFHTVTPSTASGNHTTMMFAALIGLISGLGPSPVTLAINGSLCIDRGPHTPAKVTDQELEMLPPDSQASQAEAPGMRMQTKPGRSTAVQRETLFNLNIASCASGGLGVGGKG